MLTILGSYLSTRTAEPTFAKMAANVERQMNAFFAIWLPAVCAVEFPNTYTVFAGGDDFFLIGPRRSTAARNKMASAFRTYVAENPGDHISSAGMSMTKPGLHYAYTSPHKLKGHFQPLRDTIKRCGDLNERVRWF